MNLLQLVDELRAEAPGNPGASDVEMTVSDGFPPQLLERLAKLQRLNMLSGDVVLSMVAQAAIDPIGLIELLMQQVPVGWVFSSIDFSVVRVLSREGGPAGNVSSAIRIDMMDDSVETLVLNRERQLTSFKRFDTLSQCERRSPGPWILEEVQKMCDEAVAAAAREFS